MTIFDFFYQINSKSQNTQLIIATSNFNSINIKKDKINKFYSSSIILNGNHIDINWGNVIESTCIFGIRHLVFVNVNSIMNVSYCKIKSIRAVSSKITIIDISLRTFFNIKFLNFLSKEYSSLKHVSTFF